MLKGIFPVLPTIFTNTDKIDFEAQRKVIRFAMESGAHGLVFPGVASEYNYLSLAERAELIRLVTSEVGESIPVVGGASAATVEEVVAAGSEAISNGIRHLMIMAPARFEKDIDKHCKFFHSVIEQLGEVEILLQNAPSPTGAGLDSDAIIELAASHPAITYLKEEGLPSGPTITAFLEADVAHCHAVFGGGGARYIIDELNRGALGAMPAVELTDLHVKLFEAYENGDQARARYLYQQSLPLLGCQAVYRMRLTKYVLSRRNIIGEQLSVRAPIVEMDEFCRKDIDQMLADLESVLAE